MKAARTVLALCVASIIGQMAASAQTDASGHLVIIGGGKRGPAIMNAFARLAGGERAKIVLFPMASAYADSGIAEQIEGVKRYGTGMVLHMNISRNQANSDSVLRLLDGVTGIYFGGGDQSKLTAVLKGTRVEARIRELYARGAVIGGTSAGAAVMSGLMITGDERIRTDSASAFSTIRKGNVVTAAGFGLIEGAIVDQHFIKRKRHNRLFALVLEHPDLLGIGIDEATAIVLNPDRTFDVVGDATVMVVDASGARSISTDAAGNLAAADLRVHILKSGDRFDMKARTARPSN